MAGSDEVLHIQVLEPAEVRESVPCVAEVNEGAAL